MAKIQIKRGLQSAVSNLVLAEGEFAVALDTGNVYIGTTTGTVHVNPTGGTAESAAKLTTSRNFSISGDGTASAVGFDGTSAVNLQLVLNAISGLTAGTYTKVTVDSKGRVIAGTNISVSDISDMPDYQTASQVNTAIQNVIGSAPEALDTLKELADALGNDANFATTVTTNLAGKEALIKNATNKTTVVDNDTFPISDSAASSATKKIKFSLIKSTLKSYFDTLYNKYTHPSYTAKASGLYKVTVDSTGHISATTAVAKADITGLGIPAQDTVYTLPTASSSVLGGVKVGAGLSMSSGTLSVGDVDGGTF